MEVDFPAPLRKRQLLIPPFPPILFWEIEDVLKVGVTSCYYHQELYSFSLFCFNDLLCKVPLYASQVGDVKSDYWAYVWHSSAALVVCLHFLPEEYINGKNVVEIGAGFSAVVAVAGMLALFASINSIPNRFNQSYLPEIIHLNRNRPHRSSADRRKALSVLTTDYSLLAVQLLRLNSSLNAASSVSTAVLDWNKEETWPRPESAQLLLAADILYDPAHVPAIAKLFLHLLAPNGLLLVADADRTPVPNLKEALEKAGLYTAQRDGRFVMDKQEHTVLFLVASQQPLQEELIRATEHALQHLSNNDLRLQKILPDTMPSSS